MSARIGGVVYRVSGFDYKNAYGLKMVVPVIALYHHG
jgi:hypothetical protein